ncbi:DUF6544 family protein [Aquisalimonas sp.]|uniref:DUF6544 family protein n=1 Tax=Aquisalimonas sp. TaxID=1872621 RepID=UPI0025BB3FE5|nr:DUF6544 family protein [Aquisalimonas sp.]
MMIKWIFITSGKAPLGAAIAIYIGQARDSSKADQLLATLSEGSSQTDVGIVDFASFTELPPSVARYFQHVLTDGQKLIKTAKIEQSGVLRTGITTESWSPFTASEIVVPPAIGFLWSAKIEMPLGTHVRVLDSYIGGVGLGRGSLLSAFAVASEGGEPKLNSGALHRYVAEGVWFPTALLPQSGVAWSAIKDHSALATLTDRSTSVSLEFRFNEVGEVTSIYSAGRFGQFDGGYKQVPWQGHFRDCHEEAGMRVPSYGKVGWYEDGVLQLVWKGDIIGTGYELEP